MQKVWLKGFGALVFVLWATAAAAQSAFPPPSGPVTVCGTQADPQATSWQMVFTPPGGPAGSPEAITMAAANAGCPAGSTHSFDIPAARFTIGQHQVTVIATSSFGSTTGNTYVITVNVTGQFTITAAIPPPE